MDILLSYIGQIKARIQKFSICKNLHHFHLICARVYLIKTTSQLLYKKNILKIERITL